MNRIVSFMNDSSDGTEDCCKGYTDGTHRKTLTVMKCKVMYIAMSMWFTARSQTILYN